MMRILTVVSLSLAAVGVFVLMTVDAAAERVTDQSLTQVIGGASCFNPKPTGETPCDSCEETGTPNIWKQCQDTTQEHICDYQASGQTYQPDCLAGTRECQGLLRYYGEELCLIEAPGIDPGICEADTFRYDYHGGTPGPIYCP